MTGRCQHVDVPSEGMQLGESATVQREEMRKPNSDPAHTTKAGSAQWFDDHWECALERVTYLYPRESPTTQWELFEREKTRHIDHLLKERQLSGGLVLECGCGTGGMSIYLANQRWTAIATDISRKALDLARLNAHENLESDALGQVQLLAADVLSLPFTDNSCHVVMSHGLLEHFDLLSARAVLREMVRVLRPGGLLLADISHGSFSVRKVTRWLNLPVSLVYYICRADLYSLRAMWRSYFDGFYENSLNTEDWERELKTAALSEVQVEVLRPFPPLDLTPSMDRLYVRLMQRLLRFWLWFDQAQSWFTRRWGWLYLAYGAKPR